MGQKVRVGKRRQRPLPFIAAGPYLLLRARLPPVSDRSGGFLMQKGVCLSEKQTPDIRKQSLFRLSGDLLSSEAVHRMASAGFLTHG